MRTEPSNPTSRLFTSEGKLFGSIMVFLCVNNYCSRTGRQVAGAAAPAHHLHSAGSLKPSHIRNSNQANHL
jgi:hypothetical protein